MNGRRYGRRRQGSLKAKVGIATAVVVAGGAIGVAVVATNHGPSSASSAGYYTNAGRGLSQSTLLLDALGTNSWSSSFSNLAKVSASKDLVQMSASHHRQIDIQRGTVVLVTKKFILLESKNHALHLWWLSGATKFDDVASSWNGTHALTASSSATNTAMNTGDMTPATETVTTTTTEQTMTTPVTTTQTYTAGVGGTGVTVKITVTKTTAVVVEKTTTTTSTVVEDAFTTPKLVRGDLALIVGVREDGFLHAEKVLFVPMSTSSTTPTTTPSATPTPSASTITTPTGQTAEAGNHS
jgi:hypothetical protein